MTLIWALLKISITVIASISSNPFDVTGAVSAGLKSAWIQRSSDAIFDPWEIQPTIKANSLSELSNKI